MPDQVKYYSQQTNKKRITPYSFAKNRLCKCRVTYLLQDCAINYIAISCLSSTQVGVLMFCVFGRKSNIIAEVTHCVINRIFEKKNACFILCTLHLKRVNEF